MNYDECVCVCVVYVLCVCFLPRSFCVLIQLARSIRLSCCQPQRNDSSWLNLMWQPIFRSPIKLFSTFIPLFTLTFRFFWMAFVHIFCSCCKLNLTLNRILQWMVFICLWFTHICRFLVGNSLSCSIAIFNRWFHVFVTISVLLHCPIFTLVTKFSHGLPQFQRKINRNFFLLLPSCQMELFFLLLSMCVLKTSIRHFYLARTDYNLHSTKIKLISK